MSLWRHLSRGFRALTNRSAADRDLSDEVAHYVDQAAAAHVAGGMAPDAARRAALLEIGGSTAVSEAVRGSGWEAAIESLFTDLRYAGRMLRKSPVFSLVTILVVALGTGAVTTIFSATNAMLLRPLPGARDARRLFSIDRKHVDGNQGMSASYPFYVYLRDRSKSFDGIAAWNDFPLTVSVNSVGTMAYGNIVSGNYFGVLGVRPELGRFFSPDEDRTPLAHAVLVISDGFWRTTFGADSGVIGRTVQVNGHPFTIIGVVPRAFRSVYIPLKSDVWVPVMMKPLLRPGHDLTDPSDISLHMFGRLKAGVVPEAAHREATALTHQWVAAGLDPPEWDKGYVDARLAPLSGLPEDATQAIVGFFFLLLGASTLVLLIASVNVAAMLSARAVTRGREMAVRAALGARRGRLVRQLLTESLVLFLLGAVGGIAIAVVATRAFEHLRLPDMIALDLAPDYRVIAFALVISIATGLMFGIAPALRAARTDITRRIREDSPSGGRRTAMGNLLVIGQLALSLLLLVAAGLFLRALDRGNRVDPGFDSNGVSVAALDADSWGYDGIKARAFFTGLRRTLAESPGVTSVTFAGVLPLYGERSSTLIQVDGPGSADAAASRGPGTLAGVAAVGADYFGTLRMPIVRGIPIGVRDGVTATKVAVVNETLAKTLWPDGSAVGRTINYQGDRVTVIGVARDAKYAWLTEAKTPFVFVPIAQQWTSRQFLLVRSTAPANEVAMQVRRAVQAIDPGLPAPVVTTLRESSSIVLLPQRVAAIVTGALGAIGLLMATIGLYGIISYSVSRRGREIGIRVALGARRGEVLGMVVREGMRLAAAGVVIGLVLSVAATRLMSSFLFNVSPLDSLTFVGMSLLFLGIALVSSYLPARRAASSDPMIALRTD
jgi:predicted permease